jgi:hypothetical protein
MSWICKPQACLQYLSSDLSWLKQCCIAEGKLSSRTTSFAPFLDTFYCSFDAFYVAGFWLQGHLQPVHAHKTGRIIAVINPVARVPYSAHVFVRKRAFFMHSLCILYALCIAEEASFQINLNYSCCLNLSYCRQVHHLKLRNVMVRHCKRMWQRVNLGLAARLG